RATSQPEFSGRRVLADKKDGIVTQRLIVEGFVLKHLEAVAIVAVQSAVCTYPDKSIAVLMNGIDVALGKPVRNTNLFDSPCRLGLGAITQSQKSEEGDGAEGQGGRGVRCL